MADIIPFGWAQVSIPHTHAALGRAASVVFGVENNTATSDADGIATAILQAYDDLAQGIDSQVQIGPAIVSLPDTNDEPVIGVSAGTDVGGATGDTAPGNCSVLLQKRSARGGRRGRGRMFVPWSLREADVDEVGRITTAARTLWQTRASAFLADLEAVDLPMVILHSNGNTSPGAPNLVTALTVDSVLGSQRRRLGR